MATKKKAKIRGRKKPATRRVARTKATPVAPPPIEQPTQDTRSVVFIVNGHRTTLLVRSSDPIAQHVDKVIKDAGYIPGPEWETRTADGQHLDGLGKTFSDANISHGAELFVAPKAGTQG